MHNNKCQFELKKISQKDELKRKIRLEAIFQYELRSIFARVLRDFSIFAYFLPSNTTNVSVIENYPKLDKYVYLFDAALTKHYARTQKAFVGTFKFNNDLKPIIRLALLRWREKESDLQSVRIVDTIGNDMRRAVAEARQVIAQDELQTSNFTNFEQKQNGMRLGKLSSSILSESLLARIGVIATTETQGAAESTKFMEAELFSGSMPFVLEDETIDEPENMIKREVKKTWQTVGDDKVRDTHKDINGTTISLNEPFVLSSGSRLKFPRDETFNPSLGDVINCRCSVVYES